MSSSVTLRTVSKHYGLAAVVDDVSFEVAAGEMVVLLGPSGCGKTTTLRLIAGFAEPTGGDILMDGVSITGLPPHRREMGIVFQSYALFPHLSVARNVAFGLEMRGWPRARIRERVAEMLRLVNLEPFEDRLPRDLSGGQQQRVALVRALAINPRILLFDEPLSNLDAELRQRVARDIRLLQRDNGLTAILVTHDQAEAMAMADRLVVMKDGRVQQIGGQEDLYERPATPFVAGFIGHSNLLPGRLSDGTRLELAGACIVPAGRYPFSGDATLAVRPERISLGPAGDASPARVVGQVELSTYLGAVVEHSVRIGADIRVLLRGPANGVGAARRFAPGSHVALYWDLASERLFDASDHVVAPATALAEGAASVNGGGEQCVTS
jgi:putative spermidine/putrescine transport system ATP-binding protein